MTTNFTEDQKRQGGAIARLFNFCFSIISVLILLVAVGLAWRDQSWGALYIAFIASPIANLALMILGSVSAFVVSRINQGTRLSSILPLTLGLPPLGALIIVIVTLMMPLHGC